MKENLYGYEEVVDTISDEIEIVSKAEERLKDGFQFDDLFLVLEEYPRILEFGEDWVEFKTQFKDLTPEEAKEAYAEIAERTALTPGAVQEKAVIAIKIVSRIYNLYSYAKAEAIGIFDDVKELF